jgi:glycerophosphoryl diester phosphodiesterase
VPNRPGIPLAGSRRPAIIAHRGVLLEGAENTRAAFDAAIVLGCDYIEVDTRPTADDVLVLMHDGAVDRTTSGRGRVADLTLAELRALPMRPGPEGASVGAPVMTLDELLDEYGHRIGIYVDHKAGDVLAVARSLRQAHVLEESFVLAGIADLLMLRQEAPDVATMLSPQHWLYLDGSLDLAMTRLRPRIFGSSSRFWTEARVAEAHRLGAEVMMLIDGATGNEAELHRALAIGADGLEGDNVRGALAAMGRSPRDLFAPT